MGTHKCKHQENGSFSLFFSLLCPQHLEPCPGHSWYSFKYLLNELVKKHVLSETRDYAPNVGRDRHGQVRKGFLEEAGLQLIFEEWAPTPGNCHNPTAWGPLSPLLPLFIFPTWTGEEGIPAPQPTQRAEALRSISACCAALSIITKCPALRSWHE